MSNRSKAGLSAMSNNNRVAETRGAKRKEAPLQDPSEVKGSSSKLQLYKQKQAAEKLRKQQEAEALRQELLMKNRITEEDSHIDSSVEIQDEPEPVVVPVVVEPPKYKPLPGLKYHKPADDEAGEQKKAGPTPGQTPGGTPNPLLMMMMKGKNEDEKGIETTNQSAAFRGIMKNLQSQLKGQVNDKMMKSIQEKFGQRLREGMDPARDESLQISAGETSWASLTPSEVAYEEWLEKWGHIDFGLLKFLPQIKNRRQLEASRRLQVLQDERRSRMRKISDGRTLKEIDNPNAGLGSKKKHKDKSLMFSEYSASQANPQEEMDNDEIYDLMDIVEEYPDGPPVYAKNFDFAFNANYYVMNIELNEEGTELWQTDPKEGSSVSTSSNLQGRVVAKTPISFIEPAEKDASVDFDDLLDDNKVEESIHLGDQDNKYYFQFRLDQLKHKNPRICFGVCRNDFLVNQDLSRQTNVWCMNLHSGDKFTNRRWRNYYLADDYAEADKLNHAQFGVFAETNVVGCLVDMDRGIISFYKDGHDLGQAFVAPELKEGEFYPFVQIQEVCQISIFQLVYHPLYREPPTEEDIWREEQEKAEKARLEAEQKAERKRRRKRVRLGRNPSEETVVSLLEAEGTPIAELDEELEADSQNLAFAHISDDGELSYEATRDADMHNSNFQFEELSMQIAREQLAMEESEKSSEKTRLSHQQKSRVFGEDSNPSFEFDGSQSQIQDRQLLSLQKEQDVKDIERLQEKVALMMSRVTIKDISELTSIGRSPHGSKVYEKEFYQLSMRPTIISNASQKRCINNLQLQIEQHQREIQLLKEKLAFKNKLETMQVLKPPKPTLQNARQEHLDLDLLCGLGVAKMQKDTQGDCNIF